MSDRTQGAVRTDSRPDAEEPLGSAGPGTNGSPAAGPSGSVRSATSSRPGSVRSKGARGPRRARLQLRHIDTWSALKISLVLSIMLFFAWMIAVAILYGILSGLGVFDSLNDLFGQIGGTAEARGSDIITPGVIFFGAGVIGAINIVLMTALCTVAAFIYNLSSDLVGGLEVTLAERE